MRGFMFSVQTFAVNKIGNLLYLNKTVPYKMSNMTVLVVKKIQ